MNISNELIKDYITSSYVYITIQSGNPPIYPVLVRFIKDKKDVDISELDWAKDFYDQIVEVL